MSLSPKNSVSDKPGFRVPGLRYEFEVGWAAAPHPDKAWKGGEDAMYVSKNVLVVADGVSAWSKIGVDAGIYSRRLVE